MANTCSVCRNEKREEIDEALLRGEPLRSIATRTACGAASLQRHKKAHLSALLSKAKGAEVVRANALQDQIAVQESTEAQHGDTLLTRLRTLNEETASILREARAAGTRDNGLALKAIQRLERQVELEARLLGELNEASRISLMVGTNIAVEDSNQEQAVQLADIFTLEELQDFHSRMLARQARMTPEAPVIIQA